MRFAPNTNCQPTRLVSPQGIFSGCLIFLFLASCSPKVVHFTNDRSDFESFRHYLVINLKVRESDLSEEGREIIQIINSQIDAQMTRRDYQKSPAAPDLVVRYELISNQRVEVNVNPSPFSYGYLAPTYFSRRTIEESALLIEISSAATKKLVWQASVDLNQYMRKSGQEELLENAIATLFNTYLYRAGSARPDESLIVGK